MNMAMLAVLCAGLGCAPHAGAVLEELDQTVPIWANGLHFELWYETESLIVSHISTNSSAPSVLLEVRMGGDQGILRVDIDRRLLDSVNGTEDMRFVVTADGAGAAHEETETTGQSRALEITVPPRTEEIEITGNVVAVSDVGDYEGDVVPDWLNGTIYYATERVPIVPDRNLPTNALRAAIIEWEEMNPGLEFVASDEPDLLIKWRTHPGITNRGLASCSVEGGRASCTLEISIGATSCDGGYIQPGEPSLTNLIMHEIGHALGLGHTGQEDHLMYSDGAPPGLYNPEGLVVPKIYDDLESRIDRLNDMIDEAESEYDRLGKLFEPYAGRTLASEDFFKADRLRDDLWRISGDIDAMIEEVNVMITRQNDLYGFSC